MAKTGSYVRARKKVNDASQSANSAKVVQRLPVITGGNDGLVANLQSARQCAAVDPCRCRPYHRPARGAQHLPHQCAGVRGGLERGAVSIEAVVPTYLHDPSACPGERSNLPCQRLAGG